MQSTLTIISNGSQDNPLHATHRSSKNPMEGISSASTTTIGFVKLFEQSNAARLANLLTEAHHHDPTPRQAKHPKTNTIE